MAIPFQLAKPKEFCYLAFVINLMINLDIN